jgi:hypothetical protein
MNTVLVKSHVCDWSGLSLYISLVNTNGVWLTEKGRFSTTKFVFLSEEVFYYFSLDIKQ